MSAPSSASQRLAEAARRNPVPYASGGAVVTVLGGLLVVLRSVSDATDSMSKISSALRGLGLIGAMVAVAALVVVAAVVKWMQHADELRRAVQAARDDRQDAQHQALMESFGLIAQQLQAGMGEMRADMRDLKTEVRALREERTDRTGPRPRLAPVPR